MPGKENTGRYTKGYAALHGAPCVSTRVPAGSYGDDDGFALLICLSILAESGHYARAQSQYGVDVWTVDQGLPQNLVRGLAQSPDGYLWIATFDGLVRFDGIRFTTFGQSNTPGITSNRFASMYQGKDADLWLVNEIGGLTRYHDGSFRTYGVERRSARRSRGRDNGRPSRQYLDSFSRPHRPVGRCTRALRRDRIGATERSTTSR